VLNRYCVTCHNEKLKTGNLTLDTVDVTNVSARPEVWEKVARKLRAGQMPPVGRPRPDAATYDGVTSWLETELDRAAAARPHPGRTETFHRLNRAEYQNAIRDLLAVELDIADFLPADDASYGFDNIAGVLRMSQSLMERYLDAAKKISRLAVGSPPPAIVSEIYRVVPDLQQHDRVEALPFGTRGGALVQHLFPLDAAYDVRVEVGGARGLSEPHQLEISIDGDQVKLFSIGGPQPNTADDRRVPAAERPNNTVVVAYDVETTFEARVPVPAGPHAVGVTFYRKPAVLLEQIREPFENPRISGNDGGPGGAMPYVTTVTISGPHSASGAGDTPSRRRIFVCRPSDPSQEAECAETILHRLARHAYRGFVTDADLEPLLGFYSQGRAEGALRQAQGVVSLSNHGFEAGIELALRRLLVSPQFLFRIEADPPSPGATAPNSAVNRAAATAAPRVYELSDLELASRLSFFLWSSIPDEELLDVAEQGRLKNPDELERQVRRLLVDPRSEALTTNFAGQWLQLRNLAMVRPGDPYSLTFDESLRQGLQRETELFFDSVVRENRSVLELLTADYTFLNERVARHYGLPNVRGSHFRRVTLPEDSPRRGILGHGSILTITSHAIRTSPVLRGKWILNTILGTPPPDPPPNVPALVDKKTQSRVATMRERMAEHRANPTCSSCHAMIDPAGFALENFDALGRWRPVDQSFNPIDTSGVLPDGTKFNGVDDLRAALVRVPERLVRTVTEKLLTYALGRGVEHYDMPAVRKIVRESASSDYRFQSVVLGIVNSYPFRMRKAASGEVQTAP